MIRKKARAIMQVSNGMGGTIQILDHRFDGAEWPIRFSVPGDIADEWFKRLFAECTKRGWGCSSLQQLGSDENSGSTTISSGDASASQLIIVWERRRLGPLNLRARCTGTPEFPLCLAKELFARVDELNRAGVKSHFYLRGQLCYEGLPWRGELWLGDNLRLGPPSVQDESVLLSQRIIIVDALVEGIDLPDAGSTFRVLLRELSVFLTVVMMHGVFVPHAGRAWVWSIGPTGQLESCDLRDLGYQEQEHSPQMPHKGQTRAIPMTTVTRPDLSAGGLLGTDTEMQIPADVPDLWEALAALPPDKRMKFLQAGSMFQLAFSLSHEHETAKLVWVVSACESLKPADPQFRDHNIYDVVEALLGKPSADLLREQWFQPQKKRNAYLHSGEFFGSEFVRRVMMSSFQDPTFGKAYRILTTIAPASIIEWLRRKGSFEMPTVHRPQNWRRWMMARALVLLPIVAAVGIVVGLIMGRLFFKR